MMRIRGSPFWRRFRVEKEPSVLPSSTKMISQVAGMGTQLSDDALVELRERFLFVEEGNHHGDQSHGRIFAADSNTLRGNGDFLAAD